MTNSHPHKALPERVNLQQLEGLGRVFHQISHLKIVFYLLALFFQVQAMFFSQAGAFTRNLNSMLLMYGLAMAFEGLRDNAMLSDMDRRWYLSKSKLWVWVLALMFGGGLIAMGIGFMQFFQTQDYELGWGITTFGLGVITLGRQQYDQFMEVLSSAENSTSQNAKSPQPPPG